MIWILWDDGICGTIGNTSTVDVIKHPTLSRLWKNKHNLQNFIWTVLSRRIPKFSTKFWVSTRNIATRLCSGFCVATWQISRHLNARAFGDSPKKLKSIASEDRLQLRALWTKKKLLITLLNSPSRKGKYDFVFSMYAKQRGYHALVRSFVRSFFFPPPPFWKVG